MAKKILVEYWVTEKIVFGRVAERDLCLQAETLQELAAMIEGQGDVSHGLVLVPGEELPEEITA